MNLLDILLLLIVAYCLVRGVSRGLVRELSSIIGVFGGIYASYTYYGHLAKLLSPWISKPVYQNILSCLLLFITVYLVISVIGTMIKYFMNIVFLGWTDRLCGAFFGAIKGAMICAVVILILTTFLPKNTPILSESLAARHLMKVRAAFVRAASKDEKGLFGNKMRGLNPLWQARKK